MFSVSKTGEMTAKLTAWGPNSNLLVGLAWTAANSDGSCTANAIQQNNFVSLNSQALGGQILSGKYCIFIFDVGTLTAAQTMAAESAPAGSPLAASQIFSVLSSLPVTMRLPSGLKPTLLT